MRKKVKKIIILSLISICAIATPCSYFIYKFYANPKPKDINHNQTSNPKKYIVNIEGAVENPGEYVFEVPQQLRTIIFRAKTKVEADLNSMDLDKVISENFEISVPFKIGSFEKIKWNDLNSVDQLIKLGLRKDTAQKIINYKRSNSVTTWEEIEKIKGIGKITISKIKELIFLS